LGFLWPGGSSLLKEIVRWFICNKEGVPWRIKWWLVFNSIIE